MRSGASGPRLRTTTVGAGRGAGALIAERHVFCDGAGTNNQDARLRRAGMGGYWGPGHPRNFGEPLTGQVQTNQRAELHAVVRVLDWEDRLLEIRSDSQYTVDGCRRLQQGVVASRDGAHADLWARVEAHLRARGPQAVLFTKVKRPRS